MDSQENETVNTLVSGVDIQPPNPTPTPSFTPGPPAESPLTQPPIPPSYGASSDYHLPSSKSHFGLITSLVFLVVIIVAAALYLWILPASWSNSYLKTIKPLYDNQAAQMSAVYQTTGRSVFTNSQSSQSNATDLQTIASDIQSATHATDTLKAVDHLTVLPATNWQHSVNTATNDYQAMQQYVSDCQKFLLDYSNEVSYMEGLGLVSQTLFPPIASDLNFLNSGTNNLQTFTARIQTTSTDIQNFVDKLNALKPSADLSGFNQNLLSSLSNMRDALSGEATDVKRNDVASFNSHAAVYLSAYQSFVALLNSNPTANIQTTSSIHSNITTLEAEHPIQ